MPNVFSSTSFRFVFFTILCMLALALMAHRISPAAAQTRDAPYNEVEKIGFAFYRLAGLPPPFEDWIKHTEDYKIARPAAKRDLLQKETARLSEAYARYSPGEDLIFIRTRVYVKVPDKHELRSYDRLGIRKPLQILMDEIHENYFPVEIGAMWIAVVAAELEDYFFLSLEDAQYNHLLKRLGSQGNTGRRPAILELRLRPVSVDLDEPLSLDGIAAWLMLTEIGSISLHAPDSSEEPLWQDSKDWYMPSTQRELNQLYQR